MFSIILADTGVSWTPETFYIAAAVAQLVVVLLTFRLLQLSADYNTFMNALLVVGPTNAAAFFTRDMGVVGVLITGVTLFTLLALISRGDMIKSIITWGVALSVYWALAFFVVPDTEDLSIYDVGGIPQVLIEGGLEAETLERDEIYGEDDEN